MPAAAHGPRAFGWAPHWGAGHQPAGSGRPQAPRARYGGVALAGIYALLLQFVCTLLAVSLQFVAFCNENATKPCRRNLKTSIKTNRAIPRGGSGGGWEGLGGVGEGEGG